MKFSTYARRAAVTFAVLPWLAIGPVQAEEAKSATGEAPAAAPAPATRDPRAPLSGTITLDPRLLVQLLVARSAEIEYSRMQIDVAQQLRKAEDGLYEPVYYQNLRRDVLERQRTVEERLSSIATSSLNVLDQSTNSLELGVRNRFSTGAETTFGYRQTDTKSNIIASSGAYNTEYNGALVLTIRQPLMRGRGRDVIETDRRVAEAEEKIAVQQYRQQLIKTCGDALTLYWQLYRALEVNRIRKLALENTRAIRQDTQARIQAGKLPASNMLEANATVLIREVELSRSEQGVHEAESRIQTLLNISSLNNPNVHLLAKEDTASFKMDLGTASQRYEQALRTWPAYQIARLKNEEANLRLKFADNQRKPVVDLVMSRVNTGLSSTRAQMQSITSTASYPEWYVGINVEVPLGGNQKSDSQYQAQSVRVQQSQLEIDSVANALANDIRIHLEQASGAYDELGQMRQDVELREQLFKNERIRYDSGLGLLSQLLQRESELNESRMRLTETISRLGQANIALMAADGSLLQEYGITLKD